MTTDAHGNPLVSSSPTGLSPATIKAVYGFPTNTTAAPLPGSGKTIAIVDAYDDPTAEADLNTFSSKYGLPACTTANGCFKKVDQQGGTSYPQTNSGWALEISLDVQWAHAIAPGARILLVEAASASFTNLLTAEDYAGAQAQYVSNSWGGSEFSGESSYDPHFVRSGVSFFVSAGDSGLPAEYPSASPRVISVGGTSLTFNGDGSLKSETAWSSGGGGCSAYETATSAQAGFGEYAKVSCAGKRATPDVSLDADPSSGVSVYDSTSYQGQSGWWTVGGTSASSPMWAAAAADAGAVVDSSYVYGSNIDFRDITQGNNGAVCLTGFDLCSGRGSWLYGSVAPPPAQPSLSISGGGQTITAGEPTTSMTVSISKTLSSDLTVSLSSTSGTGSFSPASVTISAGKTTSGPFTYTDSSVGTWTLTASATGATGATSGSTSVTVVSGTLSTMTVGVSAGKVSKKGPNYRVPLTVTAADASTRAPLSGASVTFLVYAGSTCAGTAVASGSGTTGSTGQVGFTFSTRRTGAWCALADVTANGYSSNSGTTNFSTP
ncbi:MAG TPA: S53 family peptidase [Gaiellaceae bacterium]|nr:S53 family peptidase [Gaiellaceae bacterium]